MKEAVLLVSFGTSHRDAAINSLDAIACDLSAENINVYQAYTSGMIIRTLAKKGIKIYNVDEAVNKAFEENIDCLYVLTSHIIPGHEYNKMLYALEKYREKFMLLKIAEPFLYRKEDCISAVSLINEIIDFKAENEYILMGHGTDANANVRYEEINSAFKKAGFTNVHIASVEAKPDIKDAIAKMRTPDEVKKVILHPFMTVAGDHAKNDMAGNKDSFLTLLKGLNYNTEAILKGLGEYKSFRNIFVEKLRDMMN